MGVFTIGKILVDSLFKKTACRMYPVVPREWEERTRGAVGIDIDGCVLCGMCQRACPTNAITVDRKAGTWSIERMNCIQCRGCVDNCPPRCLVMEQKYTEPDTEKVIDTFDIPPKKAPKKAPAAAAPAEAREAPAAEVKAKPKSLREAVVMDDETKEKVEDYIAQVRDALVNEFSMTEEKAAAAIEGANLRGQLARFPYLLKKAAQDMAERIRD